MARLLPLGYVAFAVAVFLSYSYVRPHPSAFEILVFIVVISMMISGFTILVRNSIRIENNQIAYASGPIAALVGALIILVPFASSIMSSARRIDGTCDIRGQWICVRCESTDRAKLAEIGGGGSVRFVEVEQGGAKYEGTFLFDRNILFMPYPGPGADGPIRPAMGVISDDCQRVDWNYRWSWQRETTDD